MKKYKDAEIKIEFNIDLRGFETQLAPVGIQ